MRNRMEKRVQDYCGQVVLMQGVRTRRVDINNNIPFLNVGANWLTKHECEKLRGASSPTYIAQLK